MKSVYRWIFHHQQLTKVVLVIAVTGLCYFGLDPSIFSFGVRFLITFSLLFSCYTFVASIADKLLRQPLDELEQRCDPYPLLEELELHMSKLKEDLQGQMTRINYALALVQTGRYEEALKTLQETNLEKYPSASPFAKYILYNNLCDVLTRLNRYPEAEEWYRKAQDILGKLPNNRLRKSMERTVEMNAIEALYRNQDYTGALRRLGRIPCPTQRSIMEAALLAARCNLALEEYDKAREKLQYVVDHGHKLYCVEEAKALLDTLP